MQNFKVVPKRGLVFLQRNTEIQSFTVTPKRTSIFSQRNTKFWKLYSNGHPFFDNEIQKVVPKCPFAFCPRNTKLEVVLKWSFVFLTTNNELVFRSSCNMITGNNNDIF